MSGRWILPSLPELVTLTWKILWLVLVKVPTKPCIVDSHWTSLQTKLKSMVLDSWWHGQSQCQYVLDYRSLLVYLIQKRRTYINIPMSNQMFRETFTGKIRDLCLKKWVEKGKSTLPFNEIVLFRLSQSGNFDITWGLEI